MIRRQQIRTLFNFGIYLMLLFVPGCKKEPRPIASKETAPISIKNNGVFLMVQGTVQDAGSPHIGCKKECCKDLFERQDNSRKVVSLGVLDGTHQKSYLFEATPDISTQVKRLKEAASWESPELPNGIFLTHAHIGHYTGLLYLGKEAINASETMVYAMPKMKAFLEENGPWSQLVNTKNIKIEPLSHTSTVRLTPSLRVLPFTVPHRDEYSETVGYRIVGPNKSVLFIPDINKWSVWKTDITALIQAVDYAFLDATFYDGEELNNRDISQIPHPFVVESMALFNELPNAEKKKIHFIHFNHTNPLLKEDSPQTKEVLDKGFKIARKGMVVEL